MFSTILFASGFALTAVLQPGPLQAYFLASVAQKGWRRTLPAAFAPLLSDAPIILLVLLVFNRVPLSFTYLFRVAGGIFLFYLAWKGYQSYQHWGAGETDGDELPGTIWQAALINLLNPNPYLAWSLVLGPALREAWLRHPLEGIIFLLAFYIPLVGGMALTILFFGTTRWLGDSGRRKLTLVSSVLLALLGVYLVFIGVTGLF